MITMVDAAQIMIGVCGLTTMTLATSMRYELRRLASPIGVLVSPAWLYSAYVAEQWGLFGLSTIYTVRWLQVGWRDLTIYLKSRGY